MLRTAATYFNGVSSVSQKIELTFDTEKGLFLFGSADLGFNTWPIDEVMFEHNGNVLNVQYGNDPIQHVRVDDADFISDLNNYLKKHKKLGIHQRLSGLSIKVHIAIAAGIIALIVVAYLFVLPWIAEQAVVIIPEEYDTEIGETFFNQYIENSSVDSAKSEALNLFASELKLNNSKALHFTVVESETVNAFALPDGNIVVFTGLINKMKGYEELAGLIGHEVVHINRRHSMKTLCRNLSGYLFISAVLGDVNGITATIGDNINNLQSLSFSRQFERQADFEGLNLMISNNIDPEGMTKLFIRIKEEQEISMPEFLSSHPITDNRISYIKKTIKKKKHVNTLHPQLKELFNKIRE